MNDMAEARQLLEQAKEALRLTRGYVGEDMLPALKGWSWYDATVSLPECLVPVERVSPAGGARGLSYVACGRTFGYYEPNINSWDIYGAVAVLREAGAWVCDAEAGDGLVAGCEIIAPAPGVKQPFLYLLAAVNAAPAQ